MKIFNVTSNGEDRQGYSQAIAIPYNFATCFSYCPVMTLVCSSLFSHEMDKLIRICEVKRDMVEKHPQCTFLMRIAVFEHPEIPLGSDAPGEFPRLSVHVAAGNLQSIQVSRTQPP